jgi:hypothetical protein
MVLIPFSKPNEVFLADVPKPAEERFRKFV